jgi:hypothetical protein
MSPSDPSAPRAAIPEPPPDDDLDCEELWPADLGRVQTPVSWLWDGYLRTGSITLLTSQWKSGKTTLVSVLLSRLKTGGQLAGRALKSTRAVVITEEDRQTWNERHQHLDFGDSVCFFCAPFGLRKPTPADWRALIRRLLHLARTRGIGLVIIDPLASFLPGRDENNPAAVLEALLPLRHLTAVGIAVLLLHHPAKGDCILGQAARGSGALPAHCDIVLEMRSVSRKPDDRRRRLQASSRYNATPRDLIIELNADGTDYASLGDAQDVDFTENWSRLRRLLASSCRKLTRSEIRFAWPQGDVPANATLWYWLEKARERGLVQRDGDGCKGRPYRFWLPECEEEIQSDVVNQLLEELPRCLPEEALLPEDDSDPAPKTTP